MDLTKEEKEDLISKVMALTTRDILKKPDYLVILKVCREACQRQIAEIDRVIGKPFDIVQ